MQLFIRIRIEKTCKNQCYSKLHINKKGSCPIAKSGTTPSESFCTKDNYAPWILIKWMQPVFVPTKYCCESIKRLNELIGMGSIYCPWKSASVLEVSKCFDWFHGMWMNFSSQSFKSHHTHAASFSFYLQINLNASQCS